MVTFISIPTKEKRERLRPESMLVADAGNPKKTMMTSEKKCSCLASRRAGIISEIDGR
jgi:hypothetical protein